MNILFAGAEMFPWLKVGGLGDVMGSLPAALRARGLDVRVLLPGFPRVLEALSPSRAVRTLDDFYGGPVTLRAGAGPNGVPVYALDAPHLFGGLVDPYADDGSIHRRFAAFSNFAAFVSRFGTGDGYAPDLLHAHDWQAALAPVYLAHAPERERVPTILTVHNAAYQGNFAAGLLPEMGLPEGVFHMHGVEFHGLVSFLKGGLTFADRITTVSPTYAEEICRPGSGFGLEGLLAHRRDHLLGILNGIDTEHWDPARRGALDVAFDRDSLAMRGAARRALRSRVGLAERESAPIFGVVSRLVPEKGIDFVVDAIPTLEAIGAQLVVLGRGDPRLEQRLAEAVRGKNEGLAFVTAFDESLARQIFGGADVVLVPSRYEPCGLTQLYAMRFGALPLVRRTGGLSDTVVDADASNVMGPTGFVFDEASSEALAQTIRRAAALFRDDPTRWRAMQRTAMAQDHSWAHSSEAYVALYRSLVRS